MKLTKLAVNCLALSLILATSLSVTPILAGESAPTVSAIQVPNGLTDLKAIESQVQATVKKVMPAVVGVRIPPAVGSGVIISEDGIVMTAAHVSGKPGQAVQFIFADGKTAKGITLGACNSADASLMKITDPGKWPTAPIGAAAAVKQGSWVVAMGHPLGYRPGRPPVVRLGRIAEKTDGMLKTDCPLISGDSGGPLFDLEGRVIAINSRIVTGVEVNLHVPSEVFQGFWDRLLKSEVFDLGPIARGSADVKTAFRPAVSAAKGCVVRIKCDGKEAALGTIVGPDGWVLTKASEMKGKIVCRLGDGRELEARIVGTHHALDLMMLKIDAINLPLLPWIMNQPAVGQWVITPGLEDDPVAMGVVSVPRRAIPPIGGVMGVQLIEKDGISRVAQVIAKGPADLAGLKIDDIVTHVNGQAPQGSVRVRDLVQRYRPGEVVRLLVKRGPQVLEINVTLGEISSAAAQVIKQANSLGVGVSKRSDNFAAVMQHDTMLRPVDCGGPIVNLDGKVVGINIAHAGRTESYYLPTDVLLVAMYELMSGRLSPSVYEAANKAAEEKLAAIRKAAAEKMAAEKAAAEKAAAEKAAAERKAAEERAKAEKRAAAEKKAAQQNQASSQSGVEKNTSEDDDEPEATWRKVDNVTY